MQQGRRAQRGTRKYIAQTGLQSNPHLSLQESSLERCICRSFTRHALLTVSRHSIGCCIYFTPVYDVSEGKCPHQGINKPIIKNTDYLSNTHEVPTTFQALKATRGGVDLPYTALGTKPNIRSIQLIDIPKVEVIGNRIRRFGSISLRAIVRLKRDGNTETPRNGQGQGVKRSRRRCQRRWT